MTPVGEPAPFPPPGPRPSPAVFAFAKALARLLADEDDAAPPQLEPAP